MPAVQMPVLRLFEPQQLAGTSSNSYPDTHTHTGTHKYKHTYCRFHIHRNKLALLLTLGNRGELGTEIWAITYSFLQHMLNRWDF